MIEVRLPLMMLQILSRGLEAPRPVKQAIMIFLDIGLLILSYMLTVLWVKDWVPPYPVGLWINLAIAVACGSLGLYLAGMYRSYLRYWGGSNFARALAGSVVAGLGGYIAARILSPDALSSGVFVLFIVWAVLSTSAARAMLSTLLRISVESGAEPVVIYGAGSAGQQVLSVIRASREYRPVCFVDDNAALWGQSINGLRVESPDTLRARVSSRAIARVVLALPSVNANRRRQIIGALAGLGVHVVSIPPLDEVVRGHRRIDQFLDLDVNDLLARERVTPVETLFRNRVFGKSVLVSGAGGSIGSEICRQCLAAGVSTLVLVELSESALYEIDRELRTASDLSADKTQIIPIMGDIKDREFIDRVVSSLQVDTIYHAAAFKHVPLVESNIVSGVMNNVFGTLSMVEAAARHKVKDFVLVSTDKAVNPTNVMGATKRCAELAVQAYAALNTSTRFSMVRFGNVLASSGSVVPLFREQVRKGGPVTVTHPDVTRYFMTIPEAAQLVLQAGGMATGGEVFILDMGSPVRIRDLAVQVIELMGKSVRDEQNPEGDIEIVYTDLRPGEKLYEELLISADAKSTEHPKIRRAVEPFIPWRELQLMLTDLKQRCAHSDTDACRRMLCQLVPQYSPSPQNFDWTMKAITPRLSADREPLSESVHG